jgi:uncharacterized membrane protein YfcA
MHAPPLPCNVDLTTFTLLLLASSVAAGLLGSLTGLGGGVVLVPLLVLAFGVDLKYAVGASLVAVIATSSGSAAAYIREGFTNTRIAMLLAIATTIGALAGTWVATVLPKDTVSIIFGLLLLWSAYQSFRPPKPLPPDTLPDPLGDRFKLHSTYPLPDGTHQEYAVHHVPGGFALMFIAGALSALLGIGSGSVKVLAMDRLMRIPFKVSTTTSNYMIGITAAASAGVYLRRGQVDPTIAMPVALGALAGSFVGAKILPRAKVNWLRTVFAICVGAAGVEMIYKGATGRL